MDILRIGDQGDEVKEVQQLLKEQGYYLCDKCLIDGDYGNLTYSAVQEFQGGHLGSKGLPLEPDGICGPETWWALTHASGEPQRSNIDPLVPAGLSPMRKKLLEYSCDLYRSNIREIPDGSNGGDGVDRITGGWKAPWCAMYVSYVLEHALHLEPFGHRQAAVINIYNSAKEVGWFKEKHLYTPRPGDIFIMLYKDSNGNLSGKGHTGFVLRVAEDGSAFNSQEGNAGNRLKTGLRYMSQGTLAGFVNFYPVEENNSDWEMGIVSAKQAESSIAGTR